MEKKMTYVGAIDYVLDNGDMPEDVTERLEALKTSLLKKASAKSVKKISEEDKALMTAFEGALTDTPTTVKELRIAVDNTLSPQKASAILKTLVEGGIAKVVKVKNDNLYALATED